MSEDNYKASTEIAEEFLLASNMSFCFAVAGRAAIRVLPLIGTPNGDEIGRLGRFQLAAFRAILTIICRSVATSSNVADIDWYNISKDTAKSVALDIVTKMLTEEEKAAAHLVRRAADTASASKLEAAAKKAAECIAGTQSDFSPEILEGFRYDLSLETTDTSKQAIWNEQDLSEAMIKAHLEQVQQLKSDSAGHFWLRFYEGMWKGTFTNWDLAFEVIKIAEEDWEKGYEHIAEVIAGIEARMRTAVATPLIRNSVDDAFILEGEPPLPTEILDYIKERVGGALNTALKASGNNGFDENCEEALAIAQALQSENPSAVAGLLNDASLMFQANLGNRYPEDGSLIALQAAAFSGAEEICEGDELARTRCLRASKLFLQENPEPIDEAELVEFTAEVANEAAGEAKDIIESDGRAIALGKRVGRFIRARYANYAATIVQWIDKTKKGVARVEWLWKMVRKLLGAFRDPPE